MCSRVQFQNINIELIGISSITFTTACILSICVYNVQERDMKETSRVEYEHGIIKMKHKKNMA